MQSTSWIDLFRRLPSNLHDALALTVTTGAEIIIQGIVKLEPDFAILRGRMAGTQDNGRVVILPYSQLVSVAFQRHLKDNDIQTIFGASGPMAPPIELSNGSEPLAAATEQEPEEASVPGDEAPVNPVPRPSMPSKSILLAKLRARLAEGNGAGGR